eukprot:TRINITY_DN4121_c0_g3_i1.p1 TRINITY_DN4121_c0_g3~~TRINITY_DN4121_c0_g3_i1.p1  ORF type:complete len:211 (-),score=-11.62 TRINITY_DN4121_c0_g3_i1:613-1245(-)
MIIQNVQAKFLIMCQFQKKLLVKKVPTFDNMIIISYQSSQQNTIAKSSQNKSITTIISNDIMLEQHLVNTCKNSLNIYTQNSLYKSVLVENQLYLPKPRNLNFRSLNVEDLSASQNLKYQIIETSALLSQTVIFNSNKNCIIIIFDQLYLPKPRNLNFRSLNVEDLSASQNLKYQIIETSALLSQTVIFKQQKLHNYYICNNQNQQYFPL